jgi:hypothetical protein
MKIIEMISEIRFLWELKSSKTNKSINLMSVVGSSLLQKTFTSCLMHGRATVFVEHFCDCKR